ncbi:class F sortase, partial [Streptomyces sp. NPDC059556]
VFLQKLSPGRGGHGETTPGAPPTPAVSPHARVKTYAKDRFPDDKVYGSTDRPELRLITCGGRFDKKTGYAANVIAFAHLTAVQKKTA